MFKLVKKITVASLVVAGALTVSKWAGWDNHLSTAFHDFWASVQEEAQPSPEDQVKKLKGMIAEIDPEMRACANRIAKFQDDFDELSQDIKVGAKHLEARKVGLRGLREKVRSGTANVSSDGDTPSAEELQANLERGLGAYESALADWKAKKKLLAAYEKRLDTARREMDRLSEVRDKMKAEVINIEADVTEMRLNQTASEGHVDRRNLVARYEKTLADVKKQLRVEKQTAKEYERYKLNRPSDDGAPAPKTVNTREDVLKKADALLGEDGKVAAARGTK